MLILTVFFLLGDLSKGLSDELLILGVKVSMFSVLECSICSVVLVVRPYLSVFCR